jgi:hypothetical protein
MMQKIVCRWKNELEFEVDHIYDARWVVNLVEAKCTCGRWQLNYIPYVHACATIFMHKHKPEQYLDGYYMFDKYMQAYEYKIRVMPGPAD